MEQKYEVTKSHDSLVSIELCRINGLKPVSPVTPWAKAALVVKVPFPQSQVKIKPIFPTVTNI